MDFICFRLALSLLRCVKHLQVADGWKSSWCDRCKSVKWELKCDFPVQSTGRWEGDSIWSNLICCLRKGFSFLNLRTCWDDRSISLRDDRNHLDTRWHESRFPKAFPSGGKCSIPFGHSWVKAWWLRNGAIFTKKALSLVLQQRDELIFFASDLLMLFAFCFCNQENLRNLQNASQLLPWMCSELKLQQIKPLL